MSALGEVGDTTAILSPSSLMVTDRSSLHWRSATTEVHRQARVANVRTAVAVMTFHYSKLVVHQLIGWTSLASRCKRDANSVSKISNSG